MVLPLLVDEYLATSSVTVCKLNDYIYKVLCYPLTEVPFVVNVVILATNAVVQPS